MFKKSLTLSLFAILTLFIASYSQAATITPNITTDPDIGADPTNCSLRYAIQSINDGVTFEGGCAAHSTGTLGTSDTVELGVGTYNLTIDRSGDPDDNETGDLDVDVAIVINGQGSDQTTIDASGISNNDRHVDFLMYNNVTVTALRMIGGDVSVIGEWGGAIRAFTTILNLVDVHLFENRANAGGGIVVSCAPAIENSIIEGNHAVDTDGTVTGGGIYLAFDDSCDEDAFMTIVDSWIIDNISDDTGGGISLDNSTRMTVHNSTIDGNRADDSGGGSFHSGASAGFSYSTISRNQALSDAGGGILHIGSQYLLLSNTTVSTNEAAIEGGGIYASSGLKGMYNVTVTLNEAGTSGGGVWRSGGPTNPPFNVQVYNTIMAQNTAPRGPDCFGTFSSGGYNLIGDIGVPRDCDTFTNNVMGDKVGEPGSAIDAQLGPLQLNGGSTETHALALTSPAVDMGNDMVGCQSLDIPAFFESGGITRDFFTLSDDQRFFTRPIAILDPNDPICDIGAFELQTFSFEVTKDDGLGGNSIEVNNNFTYTITLTNSGPGDAANVTLSDPLPALVSFVSLTTSQGTCAEAGGVVSCDFGTVFLGDTVIVTITVTAINAGDAVNTVTVTANQEEFVATVTTLIVSTPGGTLFIQGSGCGSSLNPSAPYPIGAILALLALLTGFVFRWVRR